MSIKDKRHTLNYPLSNTDIDEAIRIFGDKGNIIDDRNITNNSYIEDIFNDKGHVILFHKYPNQKCGHWYCLIRDPNRSVFYFDSLGKQPEYYNKNLIKFLKNNNIKNIVINQKKFQDLNGEETSVCGRYCLCMYLLNKANWDVNRIYNFLEGGKKKFGSYDKFILKFTS